MAQDSSHRRHYDIGLEPGTANYVPLTPLSFLARAAGIYPQRPACIHGSRQITYAQMYGRCRRLASALQARGIGVGDTVSVVAPNVPAMLEAHYGVPMSGAVLNAINTRLDAASIAFMLEHAEAKILLTDREFSPVIAKALATTKARPLVIDIDDPEFTGDGTRLGEVEYEDFLKTGDPEHVWHGPQDEWQAISLSYTSGTTGNPKGVVYHHRGAYLNALGNVMAWSMPECPVYLWTLPMFHCNGWCFPWSISAVSGTHICLRKVQADVIFQTIVRHRVTHFCGAPVVLNLLVHAPDDVKPDLDYTVRTMTAGSAPSATVIEAMESMGFHITHVYGLTEVYGPATVCAWHEEWNTLPVQQQAELKARQGVAYPVLESLMVADPETLEPVQPDGETLGEVMKRGNIVMKGYLKNPAATKEAFRGGWFHTGDLAVAHPDGYIELKDRSKDIIISGGENISTIEVESVLHQHPAVMEVAVVACPHDKWGETPCAFVDLNPTAAPVSEAEIIEFCREHMAAFKVPKTVIFGPLPKTSTGKIQKFVLREQARNLETPRLP